MAGYQANLEQNERGLFLFTHHELDCGTTFSVKVLLFMDLYHGPEYPTSKFGSDECEGRCLKLEDLNICFAQCRNARVRGALQEILKRMQSPVS